MSDFKVGDRVSFIYHGIEPFVGQRMTGEIVMVHTDSVLVYRDPPWRIADAACTWLWKTGDNELTILSSNDGAPK